MPDTGAPWNIPYVAGTDLVADWPTDNQTMAESIADALDDAQQLVAVKHAIFVGTQTNSTASNAAFDVTDLTITHTLADASNKLIISAYIGAIGNSEQRGNAGMAIAVDGTQVLIGTASGGLPQVAVGGWTSATTGNYITNTLAMTQVYTPGDASSHTYTLQAINLSTSTRTVYINRAENEGLADRPRATSSLVIQEIRP